MELLRWLYIILFFSLPFSLENFSLGFGIMVPSEPLQMVIGALLLFQYKEIFKLLNHYKRNALLIVLVMYVLWQWGSCIYSEMPVVSLKYTFIETLHFWVYGIGFILLYNYFNIRIFTQCVSAYIVGFIPIVLKGWLFMAGFNFIIDTSAAAMRPFYNDHTLYGSVAAFLIPLWIYITTYLRQYSKNRFLIKVLSVLILFILLATVILSFSRGAWLTLFCGFIIFLIVFFYKDSFKKISATIVIFLILIVIIIGVLFKSIQKEDIVKSTTFSNQLLSSFNWSYDVANLERINRYKCAYRMFKEKPIKGFGNNTYKFLYHEYQKKEEMTRISSDYADTNPREGTGGNSHSDYLAALTELGLIGFVLWTSVIFLSFYSGILSYLKNYNFLTLCVLFSLFTFSAHVLVNNFIHEDKLSAFVWLSWTLIVFHSKKHSTA